MLKGNDLKNTIKNEIIKYIEEYPKQKNIPAIWRTPLVGFADANDPYIRDLRRIASDTHKMPEDFLENANILISYFLPFTETLANTNIGVCQNAASQEWADAYNFTNTIMTDLNEHLVNFLINLGYRAAAPTGVIMEEGVLRSCWSQRHVAYAAGLGTFGINNMLISEKGCCGRYSSIVADIPVEPEHHLEHENCLYKSKGTCQKCIQNCFSGALTLDGFDREKCYETCRSNIAKTGVDVCGKCDTNIPCAYKIP